MTPNLREAVTRGAVPVVLTERLLRAAGQVGMSRLKSTTFVAVFQSLAKAGRADRAGKEDAAALGAGAVTAVGERTAKPTLTADAAATAVTERLVVVEAMAARVEVSHCVSKQMSAAAHQSM